MFIQGDLQKVFDALYMTGAIDPVLKMDWKKLSQEADGNRQELNIAIQLVNNFQGRADLLALALKDLTPKSLFYLALEVGREFAEYQDKNSNNSSLH